MAVESCGLRLLSCAASAVLVVCLIVLLAGPSESNETLSWILVFAAALPVGLFIAGHQARQLAVAAPAAVSRSLAGGVALLACGLFLRHSGGGDQLHHGLLALAATAALGAPFLAAWRWRDQSDRRIGASGAIAGVSLAVLALLFVPASALRPENLIPALVLAAFVSLLLRFGAGRSLPPEPRLALDVVLCGVLALVVIQLPDLTPYASNVVHHQGFFLGPANDVLHGRVILDGVWSQYGVGLIDVLALAFIVAPIGYGTLSLIVVALTTVQYLCVFVVLRLAGLGQLLTAIVVLVAAAGNLFMPIDAYPVFPSATALRFGLPYLIVLFAVVGSRYPVQARRALVAMLSVLAISAVWSFEAFVYCAGTYGFIVVVEAICRGPHIVRRIVHGAALGLAASAAAVALFSLVTLFFAGGLSWGPYVDYLRLYSSAGFGQLPVEFFSLGPPMAAAIFISATTLLWLARDRPEVLPPAMRAALAGLTGLAIVTFTYYLGRSHPNNLLVLLVPVVALGGLWVRVLLNGSVARRSSAPAVGTLLLAGAMILVAAWPSVEHKWSDTGLGLALSSRNGALRLALERMAGNPVFDYRAPAAAELLNRLPSGAPAAVLTEPELTTEILMRAGRRNLLPISHPSEDTLIESSADRVRVAAERMPAGTLLLTSLAPGSPWELSPIGLDRNFNGLQELALSILQRRFEFEPIERTPDGIELVRLVPRGVAP